MRRFKCNFCEREVPYHLFGQLIVKCYCGATYKKAVTVEITEEQE